MRLLCVFGAATAEMSCEIPMPSYCIKQKPLLSCEITQTWEKEIPFIKFFSPTFIHNFLLSKLLFTKF